MHIYILTHIHIYILTYMHNFSYPIYIGKFSTGASNNACTDCAANTYSQSYGSTSCSSCSYNEKAVAGSSACSACDVGQSTDSLQGCTDCAAGGWSVCMYACVYWCVCVYVCVFVYVCCRAEH